MKIDLSAVPFTNDMFAIDIPINKTLLLNKVDEWLKSSTPDEEGNFPEAVVKRVNIEVTDNNSGEKIRCPCVIGLSNDILSLDTEYTECLGDVLTDENLDKCTITVFEAN